MGLLGLCVGQTGSIPRKNLPGFCLQDGPAGVRNTDFNSVFPYVACLCVVSATEKFFDRVGINTAALWDKKLMYERSVAMGYEFRGKGVNCESRSHRAI